MPPLTLPPVTHNLVTNPSLTLFRIPKGVPHHRVCILLKYSTAHHPETHSYTLPPINHNLATNLSWTLSAIPKYPPPDTRAPCPCLLYMAAAIYGTRSQSILRPTHGRHVPPSHNTCGVHTPRLAAPERHLRSITMPGCPCPRWRGAPRVNSRPA